MSRHNFHKKSFIMKKIFTLLAVMAMLMATGCKHKVASVLPQAKADVELARQEAEHPALVGYFELEMQLDKPVSAISKGEDVQLLKALTVLRTADQTVKFIDRTYDEKGKVVAEDSELVKGDWLGDCVMHLDSLVLDLPDAIEKLKQTNQVLPDGDKVTLRQPLSPPFKAMYIFGTVGTFFVSVDAVTGEVALLGEETTEAPLLQKHEEVEETVEE